MPSSKNTTSLPATPLPDAAAPDEATPSWQRAREFLEECKARIVGQINAYPPPIPACDAQFNHLLEQRGKITEELGRLEAARRESSGGGDGNQALAGKALHDFLASSEFIDEKAAMKIAAE